MDGIDAGDRGTAVLGRFGGASVGAGALHGSVGDEVASAGTTVAFESVQQTHPVAGLVYSGHAQVEAVDVAARHGVGLDHAAIGDVGAGGRGARTNIGRQTARAEDAASEVGHEVDVVSGVGAIA